MTFLWPEMLWLLLLMPLFVGAYLLILRRKRKTGLRYAALSVVKEAMSGMSSFRRHISPLLLLAAVLVMILAVARPAAIVTLPSQHGTVILAMDISGSMRANDIEPSRMEAALAAARQFVSNQPRNVRIGVVAFAATASLVQSPTTNRDDILAALARFRLQRGTAVGAGLLTSLSAIFENLSFDLWLPPSDGQRFGRVQPPSRQGTNAEAQGRRGVPLGQSPPPSTDRPEPVAPGSYKSAVVVLLTDGQTNTGPDPIEAAGQAADLGVRVFTVGLGTTSGNIVGFGGRRMRVQLDEEALKTIAERTAARYYRADSETNLKDIYKSLSAQLTLEKDKTEITAIFTAVAGALVLAAALLSLLWFGRVT